MKVSLKTFQAVAIVVQIFFLISHTEASPYATTVINYQAGSNAASGYLNPYAALGEPSRVTDRDGPEAEVQPESDVTVFYPSWSRDELVSIGAGGELVVSFDHAVMDNPTNSYGIDFIIFGNAFFIDQEPSAGIAVGLYADPAKIAVSQDNQNWYDIPGIMADDLFPTQGYINTSSADGSSHDGTIPTDFTKPVDPGIDWNGKSYAEILALYDGSGGGTGVDISVTGLEWIQYVKIYQNNTDSWSAEIDGMAIVPEPATFLLFCFGGLALRKRNRN